jgi:hypothetical protein
MNPLFNRGTGPSISTLQIVPYIILTSVSHYFNDRIVLYVLLLGTLLTTIPTIQQLQYLHYFYCTYIIT